MILTKHKCDVCGLDAIHKQESMQVIFHTEQNEGRSSEPYFDHVKLDLCDECFNKCLNMGTYIHAAGAMGYNDYFFRGAPKRGFGNELDG